MTKQVLIVEDNDLNLKLFMDLLEAHDCEVTSTQDGEGAYELAKKLKPDLIIMDIQLPHVSGLDLIKQLKTDVDMKSTPIVAVTAFAMQEDEERIMQAGCEAYLSKPISINAFVDKVKQYIE